MLFGTPITYKEEPCVMITSATTTPEFEEKIAHIITNPKFYIHFGQVSAMEKIKNAEFFKDIKRPIAIFRFNNKSDISSFIEHYNIKEIYKSEISYYQKKMEVEDDIIQQQEASSIISMEEIISGKRDNNQTIGAIHGLDKHDPYDKRTDKEKAEDLLESAALYQKMVDDGIITDEAMAPAIINESESKKLPLVDINNIPEDLMNIFKEKNLHKYEIEKEIDEINKRIEKNNKLIDEGVDDDAERIKRVMGSIDMDDDDDGGKIFINKDSLNPGGFDKNTDKKTPAGPVGKTSLLEMYEEFTTLDNDDIKDLLKPDIIDGKYITDIETYIFDNTSYDMYDVNDAISNIDSSSVTEKLNVDNLPENIGKNSDMTYPTDSITVINKCPIGEEEEVYIVDIGVNKKEDIIATSNIGIMSVYNNKFIFTAKDVSVPSYVVTEKHIYMIK